MASEGARGEVIVGFEHLTPEAVFEATLEAELICFLNYNDGFVLTEVIGIVFRLTFQTLYYNLKELNHQLSKSTLHDHPPSNPDLLDLLRTTEIYQSFQN